MFIINLFAGPGAGKSTTAAGVFAALKTRGYSAELVTEFAKECAWEGRDGPLRCQPYVFGEQLWRLERLRGRGVQVAVTDSPILLSTVYAPSDVPPAFHEVVEDYHASMKRLDVFLTRVKPYDPRGRLHDELEAAWLDVCIRDALERAPGPYLTVPGTPESIPTIIAAAVAGGLGEPT